MATRSPWPQAIGALGLAAASLGAATAPAWAEMAHQWWDIDTYAHILLIPPIIAWLAWLKRVELARIAPRGWWPGAALAAAGLALWLGGARGEVNLVAQAGAVLAVQAAVLAVLGLRAGLLLAFPLAYVVFLVPFGDEIIPALQGATARMVAGLCVLFGLTASAQGIRFDTPAGLFVIARECAGVKFLIAMVALGVLVAYARMVHWRRRAALLAACVVVPILANAVRAFATIAAAQHVGAERAGGIDHLVYGWIFFALIIAAVLGTAWRFFEREPENAGLTAAALAARPWVARWAGRGESPLLLAAAVAVLAAVFALLARLG